MLKGSLKLIKDAKKKKEVVVESSHVEDEEVETEEQEENLVSEDIAMDLNKAEIEDEEKLLQKKIDWASVWRSQ